MRWRACGNVRLVVAHMKTSSLGHVNHLVELRRWIDDDLAALRDGLENNWMVGSLGFLGDDDALPALLQTQIGSDGGARRWIDS